MLRVKLNATATTCYKVREAAKNEIPLINDLLGKYFLPHETLLKYLAVKYESSMTMEERMDQMIYDHSKLVETMMENFPCQVAVHIESDKIVGVMVTNGYDSLSLKHKYKFTSAFDTCWPKSRILSDYLQYTNDMIDKAEPYKMFPDAKRILELYACAIDENHRNIDLSTYLATKIIPLAAERKFDAVLALCLSPIAKKNLQKVGMQSITDYNLSNYTNYEGGLIFEGFKEFNIVSVMAMSTRIFHHNLYEAIKRNQKT